jgi:hypothetical protein
LIGERAIENDGGGVTPGLRGFEDAERGVARQKMADEGFAVFGADERAVVDDHGERGIDLLRDREGEIVAAASDEGDFDAAAGGFGDGGAVAIGDG